MKRQSVYHIFLILLIVFFFIFQQQHTASAALSISGKSAILMEQKSGRVLFEKEAHEPRRIASITKIMTAILAVESGTLNDTVKVSKKAVYTEGSSLYLQLGEKIKMEDLVYGLMLRSGNDSAVAIAEHIGGSLEGFVFLMNQKAESIGMKNTHFANPHGLDDHEDHYSTAYDMALLTRYAMNNETFRKISGTKVHHAPNPESEWKRKWVNKNRLLTEKYRYCTGGKTGYTKRAHRTLVSTATKDNFNLIAVTLDAPSDWDDHINMFEYGFTNYKEVIVLEKGTISVKKGQHQNKVQILKNITYPLAKDEYKDVRIKYKLMKPKEWEENADKHEMVGKVQMFFQDQMISEIPVYDGGTKEKKKGFFHFFVSISLQIAGVK